jgi:hypothetical protein
MAIKIMTAPRTRSTDRTRVAAGAGGAAAVEGALTVTETPPCAVIVLLPESGLGEQRS